MPRCKSRSELYFYFVMPLISHCSLTWELLRERINTTPYGPASNPQKFRYPVFTNTVQSAFAAVSGFIYLYTSTSHPHKPGLPAPIFPTRRILPAMLLVSFTSALSSPFGYKSLNYIDYITFILAKSCKLLPVMALHVTVFRKRYPLYKYAVIVLVTLGVALFTLHQPEDMAKAAKHPSKKSMSTQEKNMYWGLFLLAINLLFDGITNSTQDHIFTAFKPYSGPQMMCAHNLFQTFLTTAYLLASPYVAATPIGQWMSMNSASNELAEAIAFIKRYPRVGYDVLAFSLCGAVGQVFIFHTLQVYSSLLLVTVTVTRKMMSMVLSVVWFGHKIQGMQWLGVALVFGGIGAEAVMNRMEKLEKQRKQRARRMSEEGRERKRLSGLGMAAHGSAIEDKKQR